VQPLPPGDPRYVDCTPVRGNEDVVTQMSSTIAWSNVHVAQLFTGHRGSGKSTEKCICSKPSRTTTPTN
jgi:DNA polymerase III gamma/tau subunit